MNITKKIQQALDRATQLHEGQMRKGSAVPYIIHPISVAHILDQYTEDEDIVCAGLLHDVLEDVPAYTARDMEREFGKRVAEIVTELTEAENFTLNDEGLRDTWQKRKNAYLHQLQQASDGAVMVACADKIHNLWSMMEIYEEKGEAMWKHFHAPAEKRWWLFGQVIEIARQRLDNPIVHELEGVYHDAVILFERAQTNPEDISSEVLGRVMTEELRKEGSLKKYWLMKSEPETFSIDDLEREGKTSWEGIRNYQARNFMRDDMKPGDMVLFYHSNAHPSGVVGIAQVASEPYPDPSAFDSESPYYDPKSTPEKPTWFLADIAFVRKLDRMVPLEELKQEPRLQDMLVVQKGSRLSIQPIAKRHFDLIEKMAERRVILTEEVEAVR